MAIIINYKSKYGEAALTHHDGAWQHDKALRHNGRFGSYKFHDSSWVRDGIRASSRIWM